MNPSIAPHWHATNGTITVIEKTRRMVSRLATSGLANGERWTARTCRSGGSCAFTAAELREMSHRFGRASLRAKHSAELAAEMRALYDAVEYFGLLQVLPVEALVGGAA